MEKIKNNTGYQAYGKKRVQREPLYSAKDIIELLGVSLSTFNRLVYSNQFPAPDAASIHQFGGISRRWKKSTVTAYIEGKQQC